MLQAAAVRSSRAELEATTDGLTGLYNHRYLHERLAEELARARQQKTKLSLCLCGLDEFRRYNESWGYKAGDEALCRGGTHHRRLEPPGRPGGALRAARSSLWCSSRPTPTARPR